MNSITFECEVITPMFLAGADGITPELRPPSIKGVLRFWWRALNGHLELHELKRQEDELFGGTDKRSAFNLRVVPIEENISTKTFKTLNRREYDLIYMAYGAVDRTYYDIGTRFKVIIRAKDNKVIQELKKAFTALVHLGGLGAKSRNGFGSIHCEEVDSFEDLIEYDGFSKKLTASFTSISNQSQIYTSIKRFRRWKTALRELKVLYADSKKSIFPKDNRVYIGAPWKNIKEPERHAKLHFMSLSRVDEGYEYRVSYLPYKYMKEYPGMSLQNTENHFGKWKKTVKEFNKELEEQQNKSGDYLINFTFNDDE